MRVGVICLVSLVLVMLRWQIAPPAVMNLPLGEAVRCQPVLRHRASRRAVLPLVKEPLRAVSPALSARQVVSITLNPARPEGGAPVVFSLETGTRRVATSRHSRVGTPTQRPFLRALPPTCGCSLKAIRFIPRPRIGGGLGLRSRKFQLHHFQALPALCGHLSYGL